MCWSENLKGEDGRKCDDDVRTVLSDTGREGVDWIYLAHDWDQWLAVLKTVMNFLVPLKMGNLTC